VIEAEPGASNVPFGVALGGLGAAPAEKLLPPMAGVLQGFIFDFEAKTRNRQFYSSWTQLYICIIWATGFSDF